VLAKAMQNAPNFWITKEEYNEMGKTCVKKIGDSLSV